jgi:flagellar biosynthesis/type III secretory pathway protein FliH
MSSLAKRGRVYRGAAHDEDDVYVLGETVRATFPADTSVATVTDILAAAERRAAGVVAAAEARAGTILAQAEASAAAVRAAARADGVSAGQAEAESEISELVELVRAAAREGKSIRDGIASQAAAVVARATMLATRRIVGDHYAADPRETAAACAEAVRSASGQEIIAVRVNPALVAGVQAALVDVAAYVRPDDAIEVGGCIIDLRQGTLDATLETRLSLMQSALAEASGEEAAA